MMLIHVDFAGDRFLILLNKRTSMDRIVETHEMRVITRSFKFPKTFEDVLLEAIFLQTCFSNLTFLIRLDNVKEMSEANE